MANRILWGCQCECHNLFRLIYENVINSLLFYFGSNSNPERERFFASTATDTSSRNLHLLVQSAMQNFIRVRFTMNQYGRY